MMVFDYVVIALMAASVFLGAWRGVFGEVIALIAWILGFFAAKWWGGQVAETLFTAINDPFLRLIAGWATVFILVLVMMALFRLAIRTLIKALGLGLSDRLLGLIFGAARGLLMILMLVAMVGMTSIPKEKWWREAYFSAPLETAVLSCKPWLPPDIAKKIEFR